VQKSYKQVVMKLWALEKEVDTVAAEQTSTFPFG